MTKEQTIFITGGTRGIGRAITEELAKEEHIHLIVGYHYNDLAAQTLQEELQKKYKKRIDLIQGDLSEIKDVEKIFQKIDEQYEVDILINNAGIAIDTLLEDKTLEDFQKVFDVNMRAPFLLSRHFGEKMYQRKSGKIINIASTNGIDTLYPESIDYDASKAALLSFTKNFAQAFAPYVQVNAVAPGWVNTEMNQNLSSDFKEQEENKILLGRFAEPEEIAKVVKFLISEDARYINSTVIRVDGGKK